MEDNLQTNSVCRLCGIQTIDTTVVNLFDTDQRYLHQIHTIFPIYVHACEPLPKTMCHICCQRLDSTYKFYTAVLQTDNNFKEKLIWMKKSKTPFKKNGITMVTLDNNNIKTEVEERIDETDNIVMNNKSISPTNSLESVIELENSSSSNSIETIILTDSSESVSSNCDDEIIIENPNNPSTIKSQLINSQNSQNDKEIISLFKLKNKLEEFNNNNNNSDNIFNNSNNKKLQIDTIKKNLFLSPSTKCEKKKTIRTRDIENEIHDRQVQSNFILEIPNTIDNKNSHLKKKLSPILHLKNSINLFENRSPLRRPRNLLDKKKYKSKIDKNSHIKNIISMLKNDKKLQKHAEVKIDKLNIKKLDDNLKKSLINSTVDVKNCIKIEKYDDKSSNYSLRITKNGSIQKPMTKIVQKKYKLRANNEDKKELRSGKLLVIKSDDKCLNLKTKHNYICKLCCEKFSSREILRLHPCYCETR
ncbi:putative uncharacterized protein DDB_G0293878 [Aphidius gifuensis]|uniref:putative uncharacterized protein DDB_G0293878 n=1 Tax=Aphidius gifuensis TaxID=684658 RepID=UPI001CDD38D0|nr:putative uncharacterized protein DDB_G0293878 [Aphidius gifuensis]